MSWRDREHRKSFAGLLLEVLLIGLGVFIALWVNSWHEEREHDALAEAALRNFAQELRTNQQAVQATRQYHETLVRELTQFLESKEPLSSERFDREVHFLGVRPVIFEHTAWDLALATQSLSYFKPALAFDISKAYTLQGAQEKLQESFYASFVSPATFASDNAKGSATAIRVYLGDVNAQEPIILQHYQTVIPEVDRALPRKEKLLPNGLAFFGGLSQSEIAEKLGAPLGTVKARIRRSLLALRAQLVAA